jgi:PPK2 family polyphosphate:nucleotide phosphotransferase
MKTEHAQKRSTSKRINYSEAFRIAPGSSVKVEEYDPDFADKHENKTSGLLRIEELKIRMCELQFKLYAEHKRSLLICLQAPDAGGKDGVIRHVVGAMNPQGCRVVSFKEPTAQELAHDFLWRIERQTPKRGEVVIFNRSHYEDLLIVRVHNLVPEKVWSKRYEQINDFEMGLFDAGTHILKFYLHISKEEQLKRFRQRLNDPARQWKISEADYTERDYWDAYRAAYDDALSKCSSEQAPWFIIPSDHKWFRDLVVAEIIVDTLEDFDMKIPAPTVNIEQIWKDYHQDAHDQKCK